MLIDGYPAENMFRGEDISDRAVSTLLSFITRKLNVQIVRDMRDEPGAGALGELFRLAQTLYEHGIISRFAPSDRLPDEPRLKSWYAICADESHHQVGGAAWERDEDALGAALSEALERYIWLSQNDYFKNEFVGTVAQARAHGAIIDPRAVAGYSQERRERSKRNVISDDTVFTWIEGDSLISGKPLIMPAQLVSGQYSRKKNPSITEPWIRHCTTNGLATWHTRNGAILRGLNELIEREAYMITWLNRFTMPRYDLEPLKARDASLRRSIAACERYGLKVHAIKMLTDAPTHAVMTVIEDIRGLEPRFTVGLKAHRSLPYAIQKALTEALRSRQGFRVWKAAGNVWDNATPVESIGHRERLYYWSVPEHAKGLEFLIEGAVEDAQKHPWDDMDEEAHLNAITAWSAEKGFECATVPLTGSACNATKLHIEMTIMPDLQPTYLTEPLRSFSARLRDVPLAFGYTPREKPFLDGPHPFS